MRVSFGIGVVDAEGGFVVAVGGGVRRWVMS